MSDIRNGRTGRQRRRAGTTLVLAAASGGLLAAAIAGSPTARADDPYTDISTYVQNSIAIGQADYSAAATDFSTPAGTNAGLVAELAGFDNTFISTPDYVLLGLTAAGTGTDYSSDGSNFFASTSLFPLTAAAEQTQASTDLGVASSEFNAALADLSSGQYFAGMDATLLAAYNDVLGEQANLLAAGFFSG